MGTYRIHHHAYETSCSSCGEPRLVGDTALSGKGALVGLAFCGKACRDSYLDQLQEA